ncbi:metadherin a isoform X3 [Xyrauchen texanus]|uniref:metadherin a isoform X3 n=1 Tax=Xyrauchen texanus TaxID=154827 RepID=UPI002242BA86|nr:metadherin a isoform X3 [Xyrauchen texanus]
MDQDWKTLATQRAEYVSDRLRGLMSSGLDFLQVELGVDLGIKPKEFPSWVILSAALSVVALLVLFAACGRRKRRATTVTATVTSSTTTDSQVKAAVLPKTVKTEPSEPRKKNKKKAADKKAQANGQTVAEPQEETQVPEEKKKKAAPAPTPARVQPPPADQKNKKNKKKPKLEMKSTKDASSTDGKEPEEAGAWEMKVSNREKRQQRKKDKGPGDGSESPEAGDRASLKVEQPVVAGATGTKKNKVTSNWNDVNSVNGRGSTEVPVKASSQMNTSNNEKWSVGRKNSDNSTWKQKSEGPCTGMDGRVKPDPNPINYAMLRLSTSGGETVTQPKIEMGQRDKVTAVDNEWSSFNGIAAVDPSSDWNAPTETWGNYEEHKVDTPALKEMPISKPLGESNDDKDKADPAGSAKSKRRKKKKGPEEESSANEVTQESSAPAEKIVTVKSNSPCVPKEEVSKQKVPPPSSQKKSDQNWEPPKQVQKKKARRET